ncbi:uncharacterized protein LOC106645666, partial [Copidosoma floridanum]|uniref:uncharacterized protein LOC106645666 n=1 Tax=Copidosoma floridanum TaxID=29053 RepID=UPI0006C99395
MMSDTDDTDILLLIPPDLFAVHSEDDSDSVSCNNRNSTVVSGLIEQVQLLESRISAIESKDSPDNSLNHTRQSLDSTMNYRQTLPRTKFSASSTPNLQKSSSKHTQCHSSLTNPNSCQHLHRTNDTHHTSKTRENNQSNTSSSNVWNKHESSKLLMEPSILQTALQNKNSLHAGTGSAERAPHSMLFSALNVCDHDAHAKSCNSLPLLNSPNKFSNSHVPLKRVKD